MSLKATEPCYIFPQCFRPVRTHSFRPKSRHKSNFLRRPTEWMTSSSFKSFFTSYQAITEASVLNMSVYGQAEHDTQLTMSDNGAQQTGRLLHNFPSRKAAVTSTGNNSNQRAICENAIQTRSGVWSAARNCHNGAETTRRCDLSKYFMPNV